MLVLLIDERPESFFSHLIHTDLASDHGLRLDFTLKG